MIYCLKTEMEMNQLKVESFDSKPIRPIFEFFDEMLIDFLIVII